MNLFGLRASGVDTEKYPLIHAECKYRLVDVYLSADLIHTFRSQAEEQANVSYVFPLPPDASVHGFTATINERTIKGVVKEKAAAKAAFDEAIANKQQAALFSQETVEVFKMMLGNVQPGETVTVHISFVSVISHEGVNDTLRLIFPTSVAPRYGTAPEGVLDVAQPAVSSPFSFEISVEVNANITTISSPSHPIVSQLGTSSPGTDDTFDPSKAHLSLSSTTFLEKDVVVIITCKDLDRPQCVVESHTSESGTPTDAYALTLVPRFKLPPLPQQEYIFLIDRSGSMGGGKIATVRSALQIMLKSLPNKGTSFNLVSFGSKHSKLWACSVPYTAENVEIASSHVDGMDADMGGTQMKNALVAAFTSRSSPTTPASIFVLTDGESWDLDDIQRATRSHVDQSKSSTSFLRVFCMGIGNDVSKAMCDGIARSGNGTVVYVGEAEKPDRKLMELLRNASGPPVVDVTLDWGLPGPNMAGDEEFVVVDDDKAQPQLSLFDASYDASKDSDKIATGASSSGIKQYPSEGSMPDIVPGSRYSFYSIVNRGSGTDHGRSKVVQLKGNVLGQPIGLEIPVAPVESVNNGLSKALIHLIAARAVIQGLEEQQSTGLVLEMGLGYGLITSQTSFVAIDEDACAIGSGEIRRSEPEDDEDEDEDMGFGLYDYDPPGAVFLEASDEEGLDDMGFDLFSNGEEVLSSSIAVETSYAAPSSAPMAMPLLPAPSYAAAPDFSTEAVPAPYATPGPLSTPASERTSAPLASQPVSLAASPVQPASRYKSAKKKEAAFDLSVESLARAQAFDGSYSPTPDLCRLLGGTESLPEMPANLRTVTMNEQAKSAMWCTILVLALLKIRFSDEADIWEAFAGKALNWVKDTFSEDSALDYERITQILEEVQVAAHATITASHPT